MDQPQAPSVGHQRLLMGYPWPSKYRQGALNSSAMHVVLTEPIHVGRYHRQAGDALCKPRSRFFDLDTLYGENERASFGRKFSCEGCRYYNERFRLVPDEDFERVKVRR